ncbi:hypothetical protein AALB39_04905 [Lachnospiraceae bacterium 54-53]
MMLSKSDMLTYLAGKADCFSAKPDPFSENGNGHGCGHNLLGAAAEFRERIGPHPYVCPIPPEVKGE